MSQWMGRRVWNADLYMHPALTAAVATCTKWNQSKSSVDGEGALGPLSYQRSDWPLMAAEGESLSFEMWPLEVDHASVDGHNPGVY